MNFSELGIPVKSRNQRGQAVHKHKVANKFSFRDRPK